MKPVNFFKKLKLSSQKELNLNYEISEYEKDLLEGNKAYEGKVLNEKRALKRQEIKKLAGKTIMKAAVAVVAITMVFSFTFATLSGCKQSINPPYSNVQIVEPGNGITVNPVDPTPTDPTIDPVDPKPTDPTIDPKDPTDPEVDPTDPTYPVDPTDPEVDPTDPTDPTIDPTDPTIDPTDPTDPEIDPTDTTDPTIDPTDPTDPEVDPTDPEVDPTNPTDPTIDPDDPNPDDPQIDPQPTQLDFSGLEEKLVEVIREKHWGILSENIISYSISEGNLNVLYEIEGKVGEEVLLGYVDGVEGIETQEDIEDIIKLITKKTFKKTSLIGKSSSDIVVDDVTYSKDGIEGDNPFARQCGVENAWMTWVTNVDRPALSSSSKTHYASGYDVLTIFEKCDCLYTRKQIIIVECDSSSTQEEIVKIALSGNSYVGGELQLEEPICLGENLKKTKQAEETVLEN